MMLLSLLLLLSAVHLHCREDFEHWKSLAENDIKKAILTRPNEGVAKNVIVFIGDGMDLNTVTASRVYKYKDGETKQLTFDTFSFLGLLKTYSADKLVPDSSSTATALFTGVKANQKTVGVDPTVKQDDCTASLNISARPKSFVDWAQEANKATGFVTTTRVTHATPSGLYAHSANRNWECESMIPTNASKCKDIARQLIEDEPGKDINVIFGGGRQCLQSDVDDSELDPVDTWACYSKDGRDLIHEWKKDKNARGFTYSVVQNRQQLLAVNPNENEYVLGVFSNSHMYMRNDNGTLNVRHNDKGREDQPSITEMTEMAIKILQNNKNGYVLMVEGGLIDYAHHRGHARSALQETSEFSDAIDLALNLTNSKDTLIIVTSDHAHSLVFTGYADRSEGVLGIAQASKWDMKIPYTTLLYGTGGPNNYQFQIINGTVQRKDPSKEDTTSYDYSQQTGMVTDETTHGGADVVVYANGPWAHLFHSVHEQTYLAYVVSYSSKIGPFKNRPLSNNASVLHKKSTTAVLLLSMLVFIFNLL